MKNIISLVIGNSSQLSHYFPNDFEKVSSRNLPPEIFSKQYDRIYLTFAEQRLHENIDLADYVRVNVDLSLELISKLKNNANKIVVYGTCELWNNYTGPISLDLPFEYDVNNNYFGYCKSKELLIQELKSEDKYGNVIVIHPFNFNSIHRKPGFLFKKIFDSIIHKTKVQIGNTYFYRDLIHPSHVVKRSIEATSDELVGSGRLIFVNDFIRDLYANFNMEYDEFVTENISSQSRNKSPIYLDSKKILYDYEKLLTHTIYELQMEISAS